MIAVGMPPGNILQALYLNERVKDLKRQGCTTFIEVGAGKGDNSVIFLRNGLKGRGFDLNDGACEINRNKNNSYITAGQYQIDNRNFFELSPDAKVDIIFSCMVIEHLPDEQLAEYFRFSRSMLSEHGRIVCIVPASKKHWGIEDDIAGHIRRFEKPDVEQLAKAHGMKIDRLAGLTYPVSNILLYLSNLIVRRNEAKMLNESQEDRTIYTGNRNVKYKTTFPAVFKLILNPIVMYPFHVLQKLCSGNRNSMVLYFELSKAK